MKAIPLSCLCIVRDQLWLVSLDPHRPACENVDANPKRLRRRSLHLEPLFYLLSIPTLNIQTLALLGRSWTPSSLSEQVMYTQLTLPTSALSPMIRFEVSLVLYFTTVLLDTRRRGR